MNGEQILFLLIAAFTLISSLIVVTSRNLFHAALALMLSFLGVAATYITLDAGFLGAAQLLVYIGAISILIIFAIMMTRRLMNTNESPFNSQHGLGLMTGLLSFAVISFIIIEIWGWQPSEAFEHASKPPIDGAILQDSVAAMGRAFVGADAYVVPFELASVLLLAALVGAIVVAWPTADQREEEGA